MDKNEVFVKEAEALQSLRVLQEIEKNPKISQRELSHHLGVALGITNSLIKALVRKGLVKIRGNSNRSLTYHLTHAGTLAKASLAMKWTLNTMEFYRQARSNIAEKLISLANQGVKSVVLYGDGELMEITAIVAPEAGLQIIGLVADSSSNGSKLALRYPTLGIERISDEKPDAVIICAEIADDSMAALSKHIKDMVQLHKLF